MEQTKISSPTELRLCFQNYDLLISQYVYLCAIKDYIERGGRSRGSYLVYDFEGELPLKQLPEQFRFTLTDDLEFDRQIQRVLYQNGSCTFRWDPVKPIPEDDNWFENVWNQYLDDEIIR